MIRYLIRLTGLFLVAIAIVLLADDVARIDFASLSGFEPQPLGALLYALMPEALNASQAFIQRYVWPPLWDPMIQTVLTWWDFAVVGAVGVALAAAARRRPVRVDPLEVNARA